MASSNSLILGTLPLIATRLTPPRLAEGSLSRERLLQRLCGQESTAQSSLFVVTAAAGYGKSTLMAQCCGEFQQRGEATAWLTLDEDDNETEQFLCYLGVALSQLSGIVITELVEQYLGHGVTVDARRYISELLSALAGNGQRNTLFIDDYHVIDNPSVHDALHYLLKYLPENLNVFIGSRTPLSIPLAKLKVANRLVEIDSEDLSFDLGEAQVLFRDNNRIEVSKSEVALLYGRTGGWAAMLQLAALSLRGVEDRERFVSAFSGEHDSVADFLAEEVLRYMPEAQARFLQRIAIVERFCAPLCLSITDDKESSAALAHLRDSLFLVQKLDQSGNWYRLHPLFRDFLLRQLTQTVESEQEMSALHRRASSWFEEEGLVAEATQHAISAGDENRALELLDEQGVSLLAQGYVFLFMGLIRRLPQELLMRSQGLLIQLTWLQLLSGHLPETRRLLGELKGQLASFDFLRQLEVHTIEVNLYGIDDELDQAQQLIDEWLPKAPTEPAYLKGSLQVVQSIICFNQLQFDRTLEISREILSEELAPANIYPHSFATCNLALVHFVRVQLKKGIELLTDKLQALQKFVVAHSQAVVLIESLLGVLQYYRGNLPQAEHFFRHGFQVLGANASADLGIVVIRTRARFLYQLQRHEETVAYLDEAEALAESRGWLRLQACVLHERVRLLITLGELPRAQDYMAEWTDQLALREESEQGISSMSQAHAAEWIRLAQARLALAKGDGAKAIEILKAMIEEFSGSGRVLRTLEAWILLARVFLACGNSEQAKQALTEALVLDSENSVIQPFRDEGGEVLKALLLLKQDLMASPDAHRHELRQRQIDIIIASSENIAAPQETEANDDRSAQVLFGGLTRRELSTLELLVEGYSNKEISNRLGVTTNTVKTHLQRAYSKLGVTSRTQAVRNLKRLGIFE